MPDESGISFRLAAHQFKPGALIVEILCDGEVCAVLYPGHANRVLLVSAHMKNIVHMDGTDESPPIPSVAIEFRPEPYRIEGGRLVKEPRRE